MPAFVFDLLSHRWDDGEVIDLRIYDGPLIKAVRDDPSEFTRDDFWLYEHLKTRGTASRTT